MELSDKTRDILNKIADPATRLGDLRLLAKDIKKDHQMAMELWSAGGYPARQLAILIMDNKLLSQQVIDQLDADILQHQPEEQLQLIDWLMANQLAKDKKTVALMEGWVDSPSTLQRRLYWYHQARLRWVGQASPANTPDLLDLIEAHIVNERPEVQWAMNFTTAQIGIFQPELRQRCIAIGERTGLYKDEVVAKNCTPNYLPLFIEIQVTKLKK